MDNVIEFPNVQAQREHAAFIERLGLCCQRHLSRDEIVVVVMATESEREMAVALNASVDTLRWIGRTGWATEAELAQWALAVARSVLSASGRLSC